MNSNRSIEWTYTFCGMVCNMAKMIQDIKTRPELPGDVVSACESAANSLESLYQALDSYRSQNRPHRRLKKVAAHFPEGLDG